MKIGYHICGKGDALDLDFEKKLVSVGVIDNLFEIIGLFDISNKYHISEVSQSKAKHT